jgi:hypothetical protein
MQHSGSLATPGLSEIAHSKIGWQDDEIRR